MLRLNPRIFCLLFVGLIGCSGSSKMTSTTSYEQASTTSSEPTSVASSGTSDSIPESKDIETSTLSTVIPEEPESTVAIEPATIGGAYLTCRYQDTAKQGDTQYPIDCSMNLPAGFIVQTVTASFRKIDAEGRAYPLVITKETLNPLSWVISDRPETYFLKTIEATIKINGSIDKLYRTEVTVAPLIQRVANYWLGGEPNNDPASGPLGEDCTEYQNLAGKNNHATVSGLTTGPLGRMNDELCTVAHSFLCKNIRNNAAPKWMVSTIVAPYASYATACPQGFRFAMPLVDAEFTEVNTVVDQIPAILKIWLPLQDRDKEGDYRILL